MNENRITSEQVDAILDASTVEKVVMHGKETLCCFLLPNGFTVTGRSACVDPANFDAEMGAKFAREDAKRQLWALEGYRLQCGLSGVRQPVNVGLAIQAGEDGVATVCEFTGGKLEAVGVDRWRAILAGGGIDHPRAIVSIEL